MFIFKNVFLLLYYVKRRPSFVVMDCYFCPCIYIGLTATTITISNHNIRILAPFRFLDPTSFQCFQTGKLGRYQNTKLPMIVIIQVLVLFFCSRFLALGIITRSNVHVYCSFRLTGLALALTYAIRGCAL